MAISRQQLAEEIAAIPDDRISEVFGIVHRFRVALEPVPASTDAGDNDFAGIWEDMPDEEFKSFLRDIKDRRHDAFTSRPAR
jgi:hypothetical protein